MVQEFSLRRHWRWVALGATLTMAAYVWIWHDPDLAALRQ